MNERRWWPVLLEIQLCFSIAYYTESDLGLAWVRPQMASWWWEASWGFEPAGAKSHRLWAKLILAEVSKGSSFITISTGTYLKPLSVLATFSSGTLCASISPSYLTKTPPLWDHWQMVSRAGIGVNHLYIHNKHAYAGIFRQGWRPYCPGEGKAAPTHYSM